MQARVEPEFLFNTLSRIKSAYENNTAQAERTLDALIAYLRAAMPKMRDTSSTVAQELDLARAYLEIVKVRMGDRLTYEIESSPDVRHVRMPPMTLLPLIDDAILRAPELPATTREIRISVESGDDRLRLIVSDSERGYRVEADGAGLSNVRERLAALYGDAARLQLAPVGSHASRAVVELPVERTAAELADGT